MWTIINGFDMTNVIPHDSIAFSASLNDPMSTLDFDVYDTGSQITLSIGMEAVVHDENTPPVPLFGGSLLPTVPASNILQETSNLLSNPPWLGTGTLSSLIIRNGDGTEFDITFNNNALGLALLQQTTQIGYIHPGQQYMFSAYLTISPNFVNATSLMKMDFLDQNNAVLAGGVSNARTNSNGGLLRVAISATAPANAVYIRIQLGAQTTVASSNSGHINVSTPQLEPMWFTGQGVSYPTPDCNYLQVNSARLPDDTMSRASRVFAGYIEDLQITYDGPNRVYHVSVAPAAKTIENTNLITANYTATFDNVIIDGIVNNNFPNLLSGNSVAPNFVAPNSIVQGLQVDATSYTDLTFREILNSLADQSGFTYYVSPYYQLFYNPLFYNVAPFSFSDTPDNVVSFAYYDYQLEIDGTQMKQRIKVIGANPTGPQIKALYSNAFGIGPYPLAQVPASVNLVSTGSGANVLTAGIKGINTFAQGYGALVDPANKAVTLAATPPSGNVEIDFTYQQPVVATVQELGSLTTQTTAPGYVVPTFDAKVNDSSLISLNAASHRGLAEISKWGLPLTIITCRSQQFVAPGYAVYFTSNRDGIVNKPLIVQKVDGKYLGNGINEYSYTLGNYQPTFVDHLRNVIKANNRTLNVGAVTTSQQTDITLTESVAWSETLTHTP